MNELSGRTAAFRVDASIDIGTGHVMRCLTLADALKAKGASCHFISRSHSGNLLDDIHHRGFAVSELTVCENIEQSLSESEAPLPSHAGWLGCDWMMDAHQTGEILAELKTDWLIVDHYALDARWENAIKPYCRKIMVIDDLADRHHVCHFLLDQNLGRIKHDYTGLVPEYCTVLVGPQYALLRPEFAGLREYSLNRRENSKLKNLLVSLGGVDKHNATGTILKALKICLLPADCRIIIVLGANAPWLDEIRTIAEQMPWKTEVLVNINDMAQQMADADLAIGAAGGTSWERCCLGLPTLLVVLAENQWFVASSLHSAEAAKLIGDESTLDQDLVPAVAEIRSNKLLSQMSHNASKLTDGLGVIRIVQHLESIK